MEKELIRSKPKAMNKKLISAIVITLSISLLAAFIVIGIMYSIEHKLNSLSSSMYLHKEYPGLVDDDEYSELKEEYNALEPWFDFPFYGHMVLGTVAALALVSLLAYLIYLSYWSSELIVTDKRVYGRAIYKHQVDLPIDSISSIGVAGIHKIIIATSSGRINFAVTEKREEFQKTITDLLVQRQNTDRQDNSNKTSATTVINNSVSEADELEKYKKLLDSGAITQEEYDAKKKQLLGL